MTPSEARKLIDGAGGSKAFALQLGIYIEADYRKLASRIGQWKLRGIPEDVLKEHAQEIAAIRLVATRRRRRRS